jgi:hypothetical protein
MLTGYAAGRKARVDIPRRYIQEMNPRVDDM